MRPEFHLPSTWRRTGAVAAITAIGLLGIVGSGGSVDAPECSFFSSTCNPGGGSVEPSAAALVVPARQSVQAGTTAVFSAQTNVAAASYQWQRSSDAGQTFADIAGATSAAFTLANVQLGDDALVFRVRVQGGAASAGSTAFASGRLAVSSLPGVVFEDADFQSALWVVSATADPTQGGPTSSEERLATGGNPGAQRSMVYAMTAGTSALRGFHAALSANYDPPSQGAINVIDYREDCIRQSTGTATANVQATVLLEQGGRRYVTATSMLCTAAVWATSDSFLSLKAADFVQLDGPPCRAGVSCPDFAASAAPLRFGFTRRVVLAAGQPAGTVVHGLDNWKVTVWRR